MGRAWEPVVTKQVKDTTAYFTVRWSRVYPADKRLINEKVPSVGGIFELYAVDKNNTLNLIGRGRAYYGGVRNTLRDFIDPLFPRSLGGIPVPHDVKLAFRYSCTASHEDMSDVLFFFAARAPRSRGHSGDTDARLSGRDDPGGDTGERPSGRDDQSDTEARQSGGGRRDAPGANRSAARGPHASDQDVDASGRYKTIYVKEVSRDRLITI